MKLRKNGAPAWLAVAMSMTLPAVPVEAADHTHAHDHDHDHGHQPAPPITEAERAAAAGDFGGHAVHDRMWHYLVTGDRLEWRDGDDDGFAHWEIDAWVGGDIDKAWLRTTGDLADGRVDSADAELLWGHRISAWWEMLAGVRHDFRPEPSRSWLAFGVQGEAPFEIGSEAIVYLGEGGQTALALEFTYDLLLTNRLVLQPMVAAELYAKDEPRHGTGSGFSTFEAALRLRYEILREFAPYIGVSWVRAIGDTADYARAEGGRAEEAQFLAGVHIWF